MAKYAIALKIDVTKIDKSKLFKGQKGTYLDAVAFVDTENVTEYGDNGMITQSVSKEEKQQGIKGAILGNGRIIWREENGNQQQQQQKQQQQNQQQQDDQDDDIPF